MTELVYCAAVAFTMTERADHLHHDNAPAHSTTLVHVFFFLTKHHITQACQPPYIPRLAPRDFWLFPKLQSPLKRSSVNATVKLHKLSQQRLSAERLAPRESDCSRMRSKVSSDWVPNYIKATRPVLEIFKWLDTFRTALSLRKYEISFTWLL